MTNRISCNRRKLERVSVAPATSERELFQLFEPVHDNIHLRRRRFDIRALNAKEPAIGSYIEAGRTCSRGGKRLLHKAFSVSPLKRLVECEPPRPSCFVL